MARFEFLRTGGIDIVWQWAKTLVTELNKFSNEVSGNGSVPTGGTMFWHSDDIPNGWLLCDGSEYENTEYPVLFVAIGTKFGGTATTFRVPDYRNKILIGAGSIAAVGVAAGAASATLTIDNLPAHNHAVNDPGHTHAFIGNSHTHAVTDPGHKHNAASGSFVVSGAGTTMGGATTGTTAAQTATATTGVTVDATTATGTNANATTGITTQNAGAGAPLSIIPPVVGQHVIMKA